MATRSVTFAAPGKAAARSAFPFSQRSTSWTAWVITILGICCPFPGEIVISDCEATLVRSFVSRGRPAIPYAAESAQGSWLMTVTLNEAASSSSSGAYAPVAAASCIWASRASADSQSAISNRTSGSSSTPYRVLPRNPSWTRSLRSDQALEHTPELVPPAGFGVHFDDHRDSHMVHPVAG